MNKLLSFTWLASWILLGLQNENRITIAPLCCFVLSFAFEKNVIKEWGEEKLPCLVMFFFLCIFSLSKLIRRWNYSIYVKNLKNRDGGKIKLIFKYVYISLVFTIIVVLLLLLRWKYRSNPINYKKFLGLTIRLDKLQLYGVYNLHLTLKEGYNLPDWL